MYEPEVIDRGLRMLCESRSAARLARLATLRIRLVVLLMCP